MNRYVLLSRASEPRDEDVERIAQMPGVTVLDRTRKQAMLVEASDDALETLRGELPHWTVAPEVTYPRPEPHVERIADDSDRS